MYIIYLLINEKQTKTYIGFSKRIIYRLHGHKSGKVKTTRDFGNFTAYKLDTALNCKEARKKEKFWKSKQGRNKLKNIIEKIKHSGPFV